MKSLTVEFMEGGLDLLEVLVSGRLQCGMCKSVFNMHDRMVRKVLFEDPHKGCPACGTRLVMPSEG